MRTEDGVAVSLICWLVVRLSVGDTDDYMTADEMAEAKHKADMDDKMKTMIREILFYVVLLFLLLLVVNGQQDTNSYRQNVNIISVFSEYLNKDVSNARFQ